MTPEETENVARSVVFDHLDDGVEFLDISENDDVPDDVSDEELEEIIKQIRQRLFALGSANNDMEYVTE